MSWDYFDRSGNEITGEQYSRLKSDSSYCTAAHDVLEVPGIGKVTVITRWYGARKFVADPLFVTKVIGDESLDISADEDEVDAQDEATALANHEAALRRYQSLIDLHAERERLVAACGAHALSEGVL